MLQRPIVFCHFPKAGGSSIARMLYSQFRTGCLHDYDHDPLCQHSGETVDHLPRETNCVWGHFQASRYDKVKDRFLFTFLRDPIENLLSIYFFWQYFPRSSNPLHQKFLDEMPDIIGFAKYGPMRHLMSESYFGGFDMEKFDFIGFHDTRDADLVALNKLTGLNFRPGVYDNKTLNGAEKREAILNDRKIMNMLKMLLAKDLSFFRIMKSERKCYRPFSSEGQILLNV